MKILLENIGTKQDKFLKNIVKGKELWLCENKLKEILPIIFKEKEIIFNKNFRINDFLFRPDFFIPEENIIIEFHGYRHFTNPKVIFRDLRKKTLCKENNIKFIEIPYFVQLTSDINKLLFNHTYDFSNGFPHGFIHPNAMLPGEFSIKGIERFKYFLNIFPKEVKYNCIESTKIRSIIDSIPYEFYLPYNKSLKDGEYIK